MQVATQMAVLQASSESDNGDCDADGFVEPMEYLFNATAADIPIGGGNIPNSIGATKNDPWGKLYGYCVWNSGSNRTVGGTAACDDDGSATENRLSGSPFNYDLVLAVISAGPDRNFATTCRDFADADVSGNGVLGDPTDLALVSKTSGSDDVILSYTYAEAATVGGGGLWSIKSSDPGTATIAKAIEFTGGLTMGTDTDVTICNSFTANLMRYNPFDGAIEACDGVGSWEQTSSKAQTFSNDNTITCDGTTLGKVQFNTTSGLPEFCDGTGWRTFALAPDNFPNLVLLPNLQTSMDVDGTDNKDPATCTGAMICGDEVTFTLQNMGAADSDPIAWSLSDGTYFVVTSENCTGVTLSNLDSCAINVRPRSNGNISYSTRIDVTANNNPFALAQGTSTGFGCSPGYVGGSGIYVACSQNDGDGIYDLVITPGGCDGSLLNPVCSGTDGGVLLRTWGPTGRLQSLCYDNNGSCPPAEQHVNIMAYQSILGIQFPASDYCDNLDYNGKTDWYLPSENIMRNLVYPQKAAGKLTGFNTGYYATSWGDYESSNGRYVVVRISDNNESQYTRASSSYVCCIRRDDIPMPALSATDTDPTDYGFTPGITYISGAIITSNTITIEEILQTITVSVVGASGSPKILLNGVDSGTSVAGVSWGDTIAIEATAPTVLGTQYSFTINVGDDVHSWNLGYADSTRTAKVFVTSNTYQGILSGLAEADLKCNTVAETSSIGLSGAWKALMSDSSVHASERIPWNWGTLEDVSGSVVADGGIADLFDGSLDIGISLDQNGDVQSGTVWTGSRSNGSTYGSGSNTCNDWTNSSGSSNGYGHRYGQVGASGDSWIDDEDYVCSSYRHLYCVEDLDDVSDTTPAMFYPQYEVQVSTSTRITSDPINLGGLSAGATPTMSVTATGGDPKFTVNGGAEVTSSIVNNGDTLVFLMTSSASGNTDQKMTITVDSVTTHWRIWTGDPTSSVVKRVFVTIADSNGNFGSVSGGDPVCQAAADANALGGTWKTILSGTAEPDWAINRIGYNWSTLELVDGTDVVLAPNLWQTESQPLLSSILMGPDGSSQINIDVHSNTASNGAAYSKINDYSNNCQNWTSTGGGSHTVYRGSSSATSYPGWLRVSYWVSGCSSRLYCIEQ